LNEHICIIKIRDTLAYWADISVSLYQYQSKGLIISASVGVDKMKAKKQTKS